MIQAMSTFRMGRIVSTPGAIAACDEQGISQFELLQRHGSGDWGDLCGEDKALNDLALTEGEGRIFSSYELPSEGRVWVITESDRSATTLLLPEEY